MCPCSRCPPPEQEEVLAPPLEKEEVSVPPIEQEEVLVPPDELEEVSVPPLEQEEVLCLPLTREGSQCLPLSASWSEFDLLFPFKRKRPKTSENSCIPKRTVLDGFWKFSFIRMQYIKF